MIENEELRSPRSLRAKKKSLDSNNELDEKATFYLTILLRLALFYPLTKSPPLL